MKKKSRSFETLRDNIFVKCFFIYSVVNDNYSIFNEVNREWVLNI